MPDWPHDSGATIETAREAKTLLRLRLGDETPVQGIGIERRGRGFGLKVGLERHAVSGTDLPDEVGGVPVRYEIVGKLKAL